MSSNDDALSSLAGQRADEVAAGRQQLDARRATTERYRANELAEAEALALARIKADTERSLAHQAQVMRDAERSAELKSIERRSADLEAMKEAQRRATLDEEAAAAAAQRIEADRLAAQAAQEKMQILGAAHAARQLRQQAERDALMAQGARRRAWVASMLFRLRNASPIAAGLAALAVGIAGGIGYGELRAHLHRSDLAQAPALKLDTELTRAPRR